MRLTHSPKAVLELLLDADAQSAEAAYLLAVTLALGMLSLALAELKTEHEEILARWCRCARRSALLVDLTEATHAYAAEALRSLDAAEAA